MLSNQNALVTGASKGIGRATAVALARAGAHVALAARSRQGLEETAALVAAEGQEALVIPTDVTDHDQVKTAVESVIAKWGRLDIVVGNAGIYYRSPLVDVTIADIERSMAVNFYGSVCPVLAALPHMREQGSGHIVLVTSVDGRKALPLDTPYVAAKFALTGFADVARQELRPEGINVTTILPGRVRTDFVAGMQFHPISRPISAEKVARAIVRAIDRNKAEVVIPFPARFLVWVHHVSPRLADWGVRFFKLEGWSEEESGR